MASDAEITLAFVAKRQGRDAMTPSEWSHVLSLELGWMAPGAAKTFVAGCEASGLLVADGDALRLGFDRKAALIPNRYRPPPDLVAGPPSAPALVPSAPPTPPVAATDLFPALVARIATERSMEKAEVIAEVDAVQERFGGRLSAEAAAVHVALRHGVDAKADAATALARITRPVP